jgi:alpha-amylase
MSNGILFQGFEWFLPDNGNYYKDMLLKLDELENMGITAIWLPPVSKGTWSNDTGYGPYDLYDLGEFDQKGTVRTKYGTKDELVNLINAIHERGIQVYADVVLNHKAGADSSEKFMAVKVDSNDRTKQIEEPREIEGWTGFNFQARQDKYSDFKWNFNHFTGVDFDQLSGDKGIFRILGENKGWNLSVSKEFGNFDYLMFTNIDHAHPQVREELKKWADWFIGELHLDGFRMDAVKHIDSIFMNEFTNHLKSQHGDDFYILGEFWDSNINANAQYLSDTEYDIALLDVGLHYSFFSASHNGESFDLRTIFDNSVVKLNPSKSVTFVDNHDSQPGQSLASFIEPWFKEIAYGLILLRQDGYPCIFYGDYYGTGGEYATQGFKEKLDVLSKIRKNHAYGSQDDYLNEPNLIGWVRHGNEEHIHKVVVVVSTKEKKSIRMFLGGDQAGKVYADFTGNCLDKVTIDHDNYGEFSAEPGSISVWLEDGITL